VTTVRFTDEARDEFLLQIDSYAAIDPELGERFRQSVMAAASLAAAHPRIGSPWKLNTRRVFPKHFPYALVYRLLGDEVVVLAVAHFRRRPTYWRGRS
jgi:plasmid stabilization system protein ParE